MVRRKDGDRGPKEHSARPRGAGVYAIVDGEVVEREQRAPAVADDAAEPPTFARAALRGKQTLPGPAVPRSEPPAAPAEEPADKPQGKKRRRRRKRKKGTLPGTGPSSPPPPAKRKETLIGVGLGKGAAESGGAPATASMPSSGEAQPTDRVVPWVGDSDARVEVEIAPLPQQEDRKAAESDAELADKAVRAGSERSNATPDGPATAAEEPAASEPPPAGAEDGDPAAAPSNERTALAEQRPGRIAGLPRSTAFAIGGLLVVVVGVVLVTMGPVSVQLGGGDPAPQANPHQTKADPGALGPAPSALSTAAPSGGPAASAAPTASAEADGSELPLHEGYLVVNGPNPKLYVYGRGKRLGKVGAKMRLLCGGITVRLGDRAPEHWYSPPRRLSVECQAVTTEMFEPGDPVSILEEAVPAEAPTSASSDAASFHPPPRSLPPPIESDMDWIPPEI